MKDNFTTLREIREDFCVNLRKIRSKNIIANKRKQLYEANQKQHDTKTTGFNIAFNKIHESIQQSFDLCQRSEFEKGFEMLSYLFTLLDRSKDSFTFDKESFAIITNQIIVFLENLLTSLD